MSLKNALSYISRNDEILSQLDISHTLLSSSEAKDLGMVRSKKNTCVMINTQRWSYPVIEFPVTDCQSVPFRSTQWYSPCLSQALAHDLCRVLVSLNLRCVRAFQVVILKSVCTFELGMILNHDMHNQPSCLNLMMSEQRQHNSGRRCSSTLSRSFTTLEDNIKSLT